MKRLPSDPTRLLELRLQDDPANLARLVRIATSAPAEPVPNLKGRIRCSLRVKSARRQRNLRAALLGSAILLTGSVVAAVAPPVLQLWQKRTIESVATIDPLPSATHPRQRRARPSRVADENLPTPAAPAELPIVPPAPEPAPPLPTPAEPTAVRPEPSAAPAWPQAKPTVDRRKPSLPRAPIALPASSTAATNRQSGSPSLPSPPSNEEPLQMAMLDSPSRQHWAPPVTPSLAAAAPPMAAAPRAVVAAPPGEQALLSKAVRSLRSDHRPENALAVLDEYGARFPSGSLLPEATRLRTEALLALGHKPAALAEMNRRFAPGGPDSEKSRLVRGELRAAAGRWQDAMEDFDAVVRAHEPSAGPTTSAKLRERFERALWGRASARSHLGDESGARADLREYLRRFPQGRFADQAARLLGEQH